MKTEQFAGDEGEGARQRGNPTEPGPEGDTDSANAPDPEEGDASGHVVVDQVDAPEEAPRDLEEQLRELKDRHIRKIAEFDNYKRRTARDLQGSREAGRADMARDLIEVLDDLDSFHQQDAGQVTVGSLQEGFDLLDRKLRKALEGAGLERMVPEGELFDPTWHEALTVVPTDAREQDQMVASVHRAGYRFGDRLLRPAQVLVYRHGE